MPFDKNDNRRQLDGNNKIHDSTSNKPFDYDKKIRQKAEQQREMVEVHHDLPTADGYINAFRGTILRLVPAQQDEIDLGKMKLADCNNSRQESPRSLEHEIQGNKQIERIWKEKHAEDIKNFVKETENLSFWKIMKEKQEYFKDALLPETVVKWTEKTGWFGRKYHMYQEVPNKYRKERSLTDYQESAQALQESYKTFLEKDNGTIQEQLQNLQTNIAKFWQQNKQKLENLPDYSWTGPHRDEKNGLSMLPDKEPKNELVEHKMERHITWILHTLQETLRDYEAWHASELDRNVGTPQRGNRRPGYDGPVDLDGKPVKENNYALERHKSFYRSKPQENFKSLLDEIIQLKEINEDTFRRFNDRLNTLWALHITKLGAIKTSQENISYTFAAFADHREEDGRSHQA